MFPSWRDRNAGVGPVHPIQALTDLVGLPDELGLRRLIGIRRRCLALVGDCDGGVVIVIAAGSKSDDQRQTRNAPNNSVDLQPTA